MISFVGAGSGAPDLITVRGQRLLWEADVVIYAGSLVNPELLKETKDGCEIYNSAKTVSYTHLLREWNQLSRSLQTESILSRWIPALRCSGW